MIVRRLIIIGLIQALSFSLIYGQGDLLAELNAEQDETNPQLVSSFKSSRLVLGPTTVQLGAKELQFRVSHLFGPASDGLQELFGLDQIYNVDIALDYGLSRGVSVGLARSSDFDKTLQSNMKVAILRQTTRGATGFSLSYLGGINVRTRDYEIERDFVDRLEYVHQLILSRKFNDKMTLQVSPGWIRLNRVPTISHPNSMLYTSLGISYMLTPSMAVNAEYHYVFSTFDDDIYERSKDALSIGVDIETGGHVFQIFISNATRLQPSGYVSQWNNDAFFDGDIHLGFSIMRSFSL